MAKAKKYYNKKNRLIAKCDLVLDSSGTCRGEIVAGCRRGAANRTATVDGNTVTFGQVYSDRFQRDTRTFEGYEDAVKFALSYVDLAFDFLSESAFSNAREEIIN